MRVLIKIGGTLLDSPESRQRLASEIAQANQGDVQAVVVHGGGKQMTRYLTEHGVESRFVNGLRVTTPDVLDAVLKVLAGSVNQELVAAFIASGARAVGLSGMDGMLTEAERMNEELGFVGKPIRSDPQLLSLLSNEGYIPVIACVAGDRDGHFYNVNADQMAVSLAAAFRAERLFFLTDVDGVRGKDNSVYSSLSTDDAQSLIDTGVALGGMRAKLDASMEAIRAGVGEVVIAPGFVENIIEKLLAGAGAGTRLLTQVGAKTHG